MVSSLQQKNRDMIQHHNKDSSQDKRIFLPVCLLQSHYLTSGSQLDGAKPLVIKK